ncbi:MAG: type II secretion system F family protein [Candidatus Aenigmatarchaeota archaeon]
MSLEDGYKKLSVVIFGGIADKYSDTFKQLKPYIAGARLGVMLKTWISMILFSSLLAYVISLAFVSAFVFFFQLELVMTIYFIAFIPILVASLTFVFFYIYPIQKSSSIKSSMDTDLPFALAHMSAIASSGVPPEAMFRLLTNFKEYRYIAKDATTIVRNIETFGMSSPVAISNVADKTPSPMFKQILEGIVSTIEKGGNIVSYLNQMSEKALFEYRIRRDNYMKMLSLYADIYTALLVAAPLMMLSVLGIMNIIGGEILGLTVNELIWLMTWIILPVLNVLFILFIHITYPEV